jgi:hypothetical protein
MWIHPLGWELRLTAANELTQAQVFRDRRRCSTQWTIGRRGCARRVGADRAGRTQGSASAQDDTRQWLFRRTTSSSSPFSVTLETIPRGRGGSRRLRGGCRWAWTQRNANRCYRVGRRPSTKPRWLGSRPSEARGTLVQCSPRILATDDGRPSLCFHSSRSADTGRRRGAGDSANDRTDRRGRGCAAGNHGRFADVESRRSLKAALAELHAAVRAELLETLSQVSPTASAAQNGLPARVARI